MTTTHSARRISATALGMMLLLGGLVGMSAPASQAASRSAETMTYVVVSGVSVDPNATYTREQLLQLEANERASEAAKAHTNVVTSPQSVASGFVLYNPGYRRSDYIYDSDWRTIYEYGCNPGCTQVSTYQTQIHDAVIGGSSKLWDITINVQYVSGNYAVAFSYYWACAINVAGSGDHYCTNGADPSQYVEPMGSSGTSVYEYFENNAYANIEYPMVGTIIDWGPTSYQASFRGYDTCAGVSSRLCTSSGQGSK